MANGRSSDSSYMMHGLPEDFKALPVRLNFDFSDTGGILLKGLTASGNVGDFHY